MKIFMKILPVALLLVAASVGVTSCADKMREAQIERANQVRDIIHSAIEEVREGLPDSTVVLTINGEPATEEDADMMHTSVVYAGSDSTLYADSAAIAAARRGPTTINIDLTDLHEDDERLIDSIIGAGLLVPLVGCMFLFGGPVFVVCLIVYFIWRTKRARYQTVENIVKAGQPIPQSLLPKNESVNNWTSGWKHIGWGVGLMLCFMAMDMEWFGLLMLCPIIIGVGKLLAFKRGIDTGDGPRDNMPSGDYTQAQPDTPPTTPIPVTPTTPKAQPTQVGEVEDVIVENGDDDSRDNLNIPPIPRRD